MTRTIVITGGTNGIGKALARHHTERGDQVVAVGSSEEGERRLREAAPKARFIRSDLSSLRQTRDLVERLKAEHPAIDALVLAAFRFNPARVETEEGFEHTFALTATLQGAKASELLGAAYASERTKYVLYNPAFVATGLHESFKQPLHDLVRVASAVFAQPVAKALPPITALIDQPPTSPLTIWKKGKPIDLAVDRNEARRLAGTIRALAP
ncbi:SDR family NAD(P)-dependent oxidoreductase [Nonomuraea sp. NPDC049158]|uniref:SDR family NAD(P)-dependent oxidoreductase n=1 Tax=Nonomuraea sp. NPDC049158 TaxID=3155649 RepID=UPI0033CA5502